MNPADYPRASPQKSKRGSGKTFRRSIRREFASTAGAVFVTLFAILLTTLLVRLLGQAAGGRIASEAVLALIAFGSLNYLPTLLSLTAFVSILFVLSRSYRDSEMVVWFSAGQPLRAWLRPVLTFAVPVAAAVGVLSLFIVPLAQEKAAEYRQRMDSRSDVAQVAPGSFRESAHADRVFFVEEIDGDRARVRNVFVAAVQGGKLGVVVASEGLVESRPEGDKFLVLLAGRRYEGMPGTPEYQMMEFERYALRIQEREATPVTASPKLASTRALLADASPPARGQLVWRLGLPISALLLALIAIPVAYANPRSGRTYSLIVALVAFLLYNNLLGLSEALVTQGRLRFEVGVWAVHALMGALLLVLFWRRSGAFAGGGRR